MLDCELDWLPTEEMVDAGEFVGDVPGVDAVPPELEPPPPQD
jgi:hypothetical protein